ncbi:MAG: hypothetical protein AAGA25_03010 [Planctomycetota bacterium]
MPSNISVQEVDVQAEKRKRLFRRGGLVIGGVVVIAVAGAASWYFTPPAMPQSIEDAQALVQSPRFERLSKEAKQPYYDVIREQYGSLDPETRRQLREEDQKLAETMREARTIQFRSMLVGLAEMDDKQRTDMMSNFGPGRPGGGPPSGRQGGGGDRGSNPGEGQRPERTPEEQAERDERLRDHISDRVANGDSQMNQLMREMFSQRRKQQQ